MELNTFCRGWIKLVPIAEAAYASISVNQLAKTKIKSAARFWASLEKFSNTVFGELGERGKFCDKAGYAVGKEPTYLR